MPANRQQIRDKAIELLQNNPAGLRYSELMRELENIFPDTPNNSIAGASWNLDSQYPEKIYKPARGLFKYHFNDSENDTNIDVQTENITRSVTEEDFYEPFSDWLKNELNECTDSCPLGSNYLGSKWGTPDVIGIYKPSIRDVIKFEPEIISAEIKKDPRDPITAFGQSIAYRLFSSKVYLVEPNIISPEDLSRIESLCILFGIGLILFQLDIEKPNFEIRVRAISTKPDYFYVNQFVDNLYNKNRDAYNNLFS